MIASLLVFALLAALSPLMADGPAQPVAFNHKLHVEQQKMECANCHQLATKSRRSGLPTANLCMACHLVIKAGSPEIKKLAAYQEKGQAIPWVRLYQLPAFVYYSHRRHVNSGIECQTCHGATGTTEVSASTRTFSMAFCMDCHRQKGASNDCAVCHQ
jgi:hypothetical protein